MATRPPARLKGGPHMDALLDRTRDMGTPTPSWGHISGDAWISVQLPDHRAEHRARTLDAACWALMCSEFPAPEDQPE